MVRKFFRAIKLFIFHYDEHFVKEHTYFYEGESQNGYVLCMGWYCFGIFGFDRLQCYCDQEELEKDLRRRRIDIS